MQNSPPQQSRAGQGSRKENARALKQVAAALLEQTCQLLEEISELPDAIRIMTHESTLIPGSTIGKHLRHSHDHYRILLESIPPSSSMAGSLRVNYDTRTRLVDMEGDAQVALKSYRDIIPVLDRAVEKVHLDKPLRLSALTPYPQEYESSFGRELWFVALHAIHHFSLLRVIATGELGLKVPDNFGVAPSTLAFREYSKASDSGDAPESSKDVTEKMEGGAEKLASKGKL